MSVSEEHAVASAVKKQSGVLRSDYSNDKRRTGELFRRHWSAVGNRYPHTLVIDQLEGGFPCFFAPTVANSGEGLVDGDPIHLSAFIRAHYR